MGNVHSVRLSIGDTFARRELRAISGESVVVPDPAYAFVHLQMRRYAGCPICSLHLKSIKKRHDELVAAGIREVVVFHSSVEDLRRVHVDLPFLVVADPQRALYAALGVTTSPRALLDPRSWGAAARGVVTGASRDPSAGSADGSFGLPADFLISREGRVVAVTYGVHADDQWSVDQLLALAKAH